MTKEIRAGVVADRIQRSRDEKRCVVPRRSVRVTRARPARDLADARSSDAPAPKPHGSRKPHLAATLALIFLLPAFAGCGYRFTGPGGPLPQGIRAVRVPVLANATPEPNVETYFTQSLREQVQRAGTLGDDKTDARIDGTILAISSVPMVTSPTPGIGLTYRLTATVDLKLVRNGVVLSQAQVSGEEDVLTPGADTLITEANRMAGLRRLADPLMREGYERLCTGW